MTDKDQVRSTEEALSLEQTLRLALEAMKIKQQVTMWANDGDRAKFNKAITAIKAALEAKDEPVDLNYQPDWKEEYQKAVDLHCLTLDELREANAWIKNLEKLMADQDAMLERQTARIVDLQTHIDNFDGEDR